MLRQAGDEKQDPEALDMAMLEEALAAVATPEDMLEDALKKVE